MATSKTHIVPARPIFSGLFFLGNFWGKFPDHPTACPLGEGFNKQGRPAQGQQDAFPPPPGCQEPHTGPPPYGVECAGVVVADAAAPGLAEHVEGVLGYGLFFSGLVHWIFTLKIWIEIPTRNFAQEFCLEIRFGIFTWNFCSEI